MSKLKKVVSAGSEGSSEGLGIYEEGRIEDKGGINSKKG